jgi:hypothetical protein
LRFCGARKPDLEPGLRPDPVKDPAGARYTRTYLWMRLGVGALGVLLPVLLISLDAIIFDGHPFVRDSMSAYYYSGMREFFVGVIFGSGAFLLAYKVSEVSLDNTASIGAGISAWLIAMSPTGLPSPKEHPKPPRPPLNPLQDLIGTGWVKGNPLRCIRRLHHLPRGGGSALWLPRREAARGAREAATALLALLPLDVRVLHGSRCAVDSGYVSDQ